MRGGLHLTSLLFSLLNAARRRRKARLQSLQDMLKESLRYTAFLGSFAGVYVAVDEGIAALFGKQRCAFAAAAWLARWCPSSPHAPQLTGICLLTGRPTGEHSLRAQQQGLLSCSPGAPLALWRCRVL